MKRCANMIIGWSPLRLLVWSPIWIVDTSMLLLWMNLNCFCKAVIEWARSQFEMYPEYIWGYLKKHQSVSYFALWPLRSGHHNKAIHCLVLLCLSPQAWLSFSSKTSCVELCAYWDQRDVTRVWVRVTYCSNRALARPAAAGPRAECAPLNSGSARIMINSHRA